MSCYMPKPGEVKANWHVVDATDQILGRLASKISMILTGKHKPTFTPHVDTGDFVIVINAEKIALTGAKLTDKMVYRHSGYPGGLSATPIGELLAKNPQRVIENAVKGMLPKNKLAGQQLTHLKVYAGSEHPHAAQQPQAFEITQVAQ